MKSKITVGIIQVRTSSTRLPGKALLPVGEKPMLLYQIERVKKSSLIDKLVIATSNHASDNRLAKLIESEGHSVFRGALNDVLSRFQACANFENANTIVRLTGDCPLSDSALIDEIITAFQSGEWDYLSNSADDNNLSVPDGYDTEVFNMCSLNRANLEAKLPSEREHVTPWMRSPEAGLRWGHFCHKPPRPYYRLTVDDSVDLEVVRSVVSALEPNEPLFGIDAVMNYLKQNPHIATQNMSTVRNEGYLASLAEDK